ncbi:putative WEB family protein At1g65010, chloroplastic [Quercus lobata]|uniref:WEB family protein n=1 Tax=Quercus lobata TaxID=97700 RepID=A0A7N2M267_QUELO|nr:putative WEB family protein At1g65010, chloroplastic [Quercus lobata]XP_030974853.1 putative WEB family protein At1g65010, chloroplastic [Quercus lobata]
MQQHMGQLEEGLKMRKGQLYDIEKERDQALDELKEMKKVAEEANMKLSDALSTNKVALIQMELNSVKDSLSIVSQELSNKDKNFESLKVELEKAKQLELNRAERDPSSDKFKGESSILKTCEANTKALLSESKIRIQELEAEIKKGKEMEKKTFDSMLAQAEQLEQNKILLEESKLEIASLREQVEKLKGSYGQSNASQSCLEENLLLKKALENLNSEVLLANETLAHAQEGERLASSKVKSLMEEIELLKNELMLATEAEENGKTAMDDLAVVLKEVATEAHEVKEKLSVTQAELEYTKVEAEHLKVLLKIMEDKHKEVLDESRKEADLYKNTAERLRLEAEDSLLAWNGKETGFVECIKRAEDERFAAQEENSRLLEFLTEARNMVTASKEENQKLRDILKQALNEANVAKEAAGIAQVENSQLKDSLAEKEDTLNYLTRATENLRINEAAAFGNIKAMNRLLSETSKTELKKDDKDKSSRKESKKEDKELRRNFRTQNSIDKERIDGNISKTTSFNLKEMKLHNKQKDVNEGPENDEAIFDILTSQDLAAHHRIKSSSVSIDDGQKVQLEDFYHLDATLSDDFDNDRNSRKKKALLRRFGDLIRRKSSPPTETIN